MKGSDVLNFKKRLLCTVAIDTVALAVCLLTFSYFHHVRVRDVTPTSVAAPALAAAQAAQAAALESGGATAALPESGSPAEDAGGESGGAEHLSAGLDTSGMFGAKFADKFASGEAEVTDSSYKSKNVSIEIAKKQMNTSTYYVADIYIRDVSCFRTGVAMEYKEFNENDRKNVMQTPQLAQLTDAVLAISGDNYVYRNAGVLAVRNGMEWAKKSPYTDDVCVMYFDGSMEVFSSKAASAWREYVDGVYEKGPYQIWSFGPSLLDENGKAKTSFSNNSIFPENPRSALGYYEPGHYCFVLVDGRQAGYSVGLTLAELSTVFEELGCTLAYNMDGGDTVAMTYRGEFVNHPQDAEPRPTSDILLIGEPVDLTTLMTQSGEEA